MGDFNELAEVKKQIQKFRDMFRDNPVKQIKEGTWFEKILQMVLTEHAEKVNAEYFKKKYIGLDNERIAYKLVDTAAHYAAIAGGIAALAVSATELSTVVTGGWTLAAIGASIIGEISYISYLQVKLIYDISVILDARLDRNDPEDIITIFWYALGVNIWEDISNVILEAGPRSANYLGRKALRAGVRKIIVEIVSKIGGKKLAQKITEKALLKLIVPGINIPIAAIVNKKFTKVLGKKAIKSLKSRGLTIRIIDNLSKYERYNQIITIPLIYHIGIIDEPKEGLSKNIEMQNNVARRLVVQENEEEIINDLISLDFVDFCSVISDVENRDVANLLCDIVICSFLLSITKNKEKLIKLGDSLNINITDSKIEEYRKKIY